MLCWHRMFFCLVEAIKSLLTWSYLTSVGGRKYKTKKWVCSYLNLGRWEFNDILPQVLMNCGYCVHLNRRQLCLAFAPDHFLNVKLNWYEFKLGVCPVAILFPNFALILQFTQMAWLGIFHQQPFSTPMPRRDNSHVKMASLGLRTHVSRVTPGLWRFLYRLNYWAAELVQ